MPLKFKKIFPLAIVLLVLIGCESGRSGPDLSEVFGHAEEMENLKSLIVYKNGDIIREGYYHGGHADSLHDVRSVTKSVMATLVGIAIDRSLIGSENQKIGVLLSSLVESMDSAKAEITLAQVLSMTSGLDGNELADAFEYNNWVNAPDQLTYTLDKPLVHTPGTYFAYSSGVSHLTSAILTQASGWSTLQYAMQHLFTPMGISWPQWSTDKRGIYNGGAGLKITPHDMLKIGKLYLHNGRFNGARILSESWIEKATTAQIALSTNIMSFAQGYGYYWWIGNINSRDYFFANGWGGQFIVVVPELELIVVATNRWSGVSTDTAQQQWYDTLNLIMNEIVAAY
jgi:CubicO group peptidase (beta-lactamase class C family)